MSAPTPADLAAVRLPELIDAWLHHQADLTSDRNDAWQRREPHQVRRSALSALAIAATIDDRLTGVRWRTAVDALDHGATPAEIAAALGEDDVELVAEHIRSWAELLVLDGRMTRERRGQIGRKLAAVPRPERPRVLDPAQSAEVQALADALYEAVGVEVHPDVLAGLIRAAAGGAR